VDKGAGLRFLCAQAGYAAEEVLAVGDSDVDLPLLRAAGYSAAPANANPEIKRVAGYVSPCETTQGVRDILQHFEIVEPT